MAGKATEEGRKCDGEGREGRKRRRRERGKQVAALLSLSIPPPPKVDKHETVGHRRRRYMRNTLYCTHIQGPWNEWICAMKEDAN